MILLDKDCRAFCSIDCSQGHTWADMILPLNHMSVAMVMTFKGFSECCGHPDRFDGFALPQSNVSLSHGVIAAT